MSFRRSATSSRSDRDRVKHRVRPSRSWGSRTPPGAPHWSAAVVVPRRVLRAVSPPRSWTHRINPEDVVCRQVRVHCLERPSSTQRPAVIAQAALSARLPAVRDTAAGQFASALLCATGVPEKFMPLVVCVTTGTMPSCRPARGQSHHGYPRREGFGPNISARRGQALAGGPGVERLRRESEIWWGRTLCSKALHRSAHTSGTVAPSRQPERWQSPLEWLPSAPCSRAA